MGIDGRRKSRKEGGSSMCGLGALAPGCAHHLCCVDPVCPCLPGAHVLRRKTQNGSQDPEAVITVQGSVVGCKPGPPSVSGDTGGRQLGRSGSGLSLRAMS